VWKSLASESKHHWLPLRDGAVAAARQAEWRRDRAEKHATHARIQEERARMGVKDVFPLLLLQSPLRSALLLPAGCFSIADVVGATGWLQAWAGLGDALAGGGLGNAASPWTVVVLPRGPGCALGPIGSAAP
jgi:hypothetical protein